MIYEKQSDMIDDKIKLFYNFSREFGKEFHLEIHNYFPSFRLVNYENFGDENFHLSYSRNALLQNEGYGDGAFVLFEPSFETNTGFIVIDIDNKVYLKDYQKGILRKKLADSLSNFLKKFTFSINYLPKVKEILGRMASCKISLEDRSSDSELAAYIYHAIKERNYGFEVICDFEVVDERRLHFIKLIKDNKEISIEINYFFKNRDELALSKYFELYFNPIIKENFDVEEGITIVHENSWDAMAKIVFVSKKEMEELKEANLILDLHLVG